MFKKVKELKLKVKIAIIAFVVVFVTTVVLALYSTIKVVQLQNIIEEHIECANISCNHMM